MKPMLFDLYVGLYIETELSIPEVVNLIHSNLGGKRERSYGLEFGDVCNIAIMKNKGHDISLTQHPTDGFLYFRHRGEVFNMTKDETSSYEELIELAQFLNTIIKVLRDNGCKVVASCDFEELIEDDYVEVRAMYGFPRRH